MVSTQEEGGCYHIVSVPENQICHLSVCSSVVFFVFSDSRFDFRKFSVFSAFVSRKNQICHLSVCSTVVFFQAGSPRDPIFHGHQVSSEMTCPHFRFVGPSQHIPFTPTAITASSLFVIAPASSPRPCHVPTLFSLTLLRRK